MIRAEINLRDFHRWMGCKRLQDQDHAMHCFLAECFGSPPSKEHPEREGLAPQPFRLIVPRGASTGVLYGYGQADADALQETALICTDPLQSRVMPFEKLDSKAMPQSWRAGLELGFEARIRPVIRHPHGGECVSDGRKCRERRLSRKLQCRNCRRNPEQDAFQAEAELHPMGEMNRSREQVYSEWLSTQLARLGGASLDLERTKLISFRRTRAYRKRRGSRYSEGPDAVIRGVITVTNSEAFTSLLARGVGRHRAYGYGMLLLRPVGRTG